MRKLFAIAGLLLLASVSARAQSSPGFVGGQLITADGLNKAFAMKQNYAAALYDLSTLATSAPSNTLPYFEGGGAIGAASIGSGLQFVGGVLSTTGSPGGVWTPAQGGTGVNNGTYTITLGGSFVTGGALNFAPLTTAGDLLEVTAAGNVNQTPTGSGILTALGNAVNTTGGFGTVGTTGSNVGLLNANKTDTGSNTYSGNNDWTGGVAGTVAPHTATLTTLEALSTANFPNGVWRDTYGNGNGAPPLFYIPSGSACTDNAGAGDNGSQVPSADSKCWLGVFNSQDIDAREFGIYANNSTASYTQLQAALTYGTTLLSPKIVVPAMPTATGGVVCLGGPITVSNEQLEVDSSIAACNYGAQALVTLTGVKAVLSGYASVLGKGGWTAGGETVGATNPTVAISSCVQCIVKEITLTGGTYSIDDGGVDTVIDDVHANADYGASYRKTADAAWIYRLQADNHEWPDVEPAYPLTITARTNSLTVTPGEVLSIVQGGVTYILQVMSGTLTGTSPPTVLPYVASISDNIGGGNAVEQLQGVNTDYSLLFTTGAEEVYGDHIDMSSGNSSGLRLDNALAGTAPHTISITHSVVSQVRGTLLDLNAGSGFSFDTGELSGCLTASCPLVAFGTAWTGGADVHDLLIFGNGGSAFVDQQGSGYNMLHDNPSVGPFAVNGIIINENHDHIDNNIYTGTSSLPIDLQSGVSIAHVHGNDCTASGSTLTNAGTVSTTLPASGGSSINALPIADNTGC